MIPLFHTGIEEILKFSMVLGIALVIAIGIVVCLLTYLYALCNRLIFPLIAGLAREILEKRFPTLFSEISKNDPDRPIHPDDESC